MISCLRINLLTLLSLSVLFPLGCFLRENSNKILKLSWKYMYRVYGVCVCVCVCGEQGLGNFLFGSSCELMLLNCGVGEDS